MAVSQGEWLRVLENKSSQVSWLLGSGGEATRNVSSFQSFLPTWNVLSFDTPTRPHTLSAVIDNSVHAFLENFVGLDMRKPSFITGDLPFVRRSAPVVLAIFSYLFVVLIWSSHIKRAGLKPRVRDPTWLQRFVILHNSFLCGLSLYLGVGILSEAMRHRYSFWGNPYNDKELKMGFYIYLFYVSKLYEFVDTAVMLWRRNLRQVTYLHLYHHASISFVWWIISYLSPTGDAYFSAAFNSWIHVAMYLYYLLAATVAKEERHRRKYLFWGKYLTMMQMVQFLSFIAQALYGMLRPAAYAKNVPRMLFFYSLSLLMFFTNFFLSKYGRAHRSHTKPTKAE